MTVLWAKQALTSDGWQQDVLVTIGDDGYICALETGAQPGGKQLDILLPAPANTHSHAFQRAMAGMTERRGPDPRDSFWTWREVMYRFVDLLTPDDIEAIAAFLYMEMLEAGFSSVAEFHYLHHGLGGVPYDNIAETAHRITSAANAAGMGLTLLPVLYMQGGCDGRPLVGGQQRFGNSTDQFAALVDASKGAVSSLPADSKLGVAAHSLRAVTPENLSFAASLAPQSPFHIHIAEQDAEVEEIIKHHGQRPVEYLLNHHDVDARWSLIHATQMTEAETSALAKTGAVANLCPITESSLGDGIFNAREYMQAGGMFSIGSDSNVRISLVEELRTLEYTQRLKHRERAVLATNDRSVGHILWQGAAAGGARANGRKSGEIAVGKLGDLLALDGNVSDLVGKDSDMILDSFIFSGSSNMVTDVWSAGRHMVRGGGHINRETITANYKKTILSLQQKI